MNNFKAKRLFINKCIEAYMDITGIEYYHKDLVEMVDYINECYIDYMKGYEPDGYYKEWNLYALTYDDDIESLGSYETPKEFVTHYLETSDPLYNYMLKW